MIDYKSKPLTKSLVDSIEVKQNLLADIEFQAVFDKASNEILNSYTNGGRLYIAGNGGSAADSQHLAAEFVSKLSFDRAPLPAEALTTDTSIITAIGNDYGYENIFSRQIECKMRGNDVFLGITTSGNSKNIIKALETCNSLNFKSIVLTGGNGGRVISENLATYSLCVPSESTAVIQEVHILIAHTFCRSVEDNLFRR